MSLTRDLKAVDLPVYRDAGDSWTVIGETGIYTVGLSPITGEIRCNCKAATFRCACSHIKAVSLIHQGLRHAA